MNRMYDFDVQISKIADDFFEAYKRCCEPKNLHIDEFGRTIGATINVPAIVNASFACELYLKNILVNSHHNHNLKLLYQDPSLNIQLELKTIATQELSKMNFNSDFEEYLNDISESFVSWRYIYEYDFTTGFLGKKVNEYIQLFNILLPIFKEISDKYSPKNPITPLN